ncbi:hypothetical protein TRM7557_02492 [Tritonibacter multivorans]|uniref:Glycerophosphoryl diester phosphodiesterase membrane domain-containing protein n=1 Tax=Tritonibacter multivorans TaxID=928856 RepID=A0A0P1GE82_9RHOB|nr:hypothetical protein [Tritonibacter multivorans]MDA7420070.1 hypothetical protein [Tritonibacter multivorans]CUH79628.1 hypothetical protein TRM7557_02492 [Tritonibacter multivorans]SFC05802.1 hypothetical protein SAMN04488049_101226 [Tritonibacter multivorans]
MTGLHILNHSVQMILRNLQDIAKLTVIPLVIYAVLASYSLNLLTKAMIEQDYAEHFILGGAGFLVSMLFLVWAVVNWHRYVLLEEYPTGWLNLPKSDRIFAYVGQMLVLFLVGFVFMLIFGFVAGVIGVAVSQIAAFAIIVVGWLVLIPVATRLSLILPAAAIGQPLTLKEAWSKTQGAMGIVVVLVILLGLIGGFVQLVATFALGPVSPGLAAIFAFGSQVLLGLLNVSTLTTLYGHYVEGRPVTG